MPLHAIVPPAVRLHNAVAADYIARVLPERLEQLTVPLTPLTPLARVGDLIANFRRHLMGSFSTEQLFSTAAQEVTISRSGELFGAPTDAGVVLIGHNSSHIEPHAYLNRDGQLEALFVFNISGCREYLDLRNQTDQPAAPHWYFKLVSHISLFLSTIADRGTNVPKLPEIDGLHELASAETDSGIADALALGYAARVARINTIIQKADGGRLWELRAAPRSLLKFVDPDTNFQRFIESGATEVALETHSGTSLYTVSDARHSIRFALDVSGCLNMVHYGRQPLFCRSEASVSDLAHWERLAEMVIERMEIGEAR